MKKFISIPAFVFGPIKSKTTTIEKIKRQENILEIEFPVFSSQEVMNFAEKLALKKRKAHDRPIDEIIDTLDQVRSLWINPSYEPRKEAVEFIGMMTGQSQQLCNVELTGAFDLWSRKNIEVVLNEELGGKSILENWIPKGTIKIHAQPHGLFLHNLAGNAFGVSLLSLYYGLITKNVNLIKLAHEEPYFAVKLAESIAEVNKKIAHELAILYWSGNNGEIYDKLFNSGYIDGVMAWGGLNSIENIRQRAKRYGIKIIDHGPKVSFSIISEEILNDPKQYQELAQKIAIDVSFWNQKACVSPRVIYIKEKDRISAVNIKEEKKAEIQDKEIFIHPEVFNTHGFDNLIDNNNLNQNFENLMKRSVKLLKSQITEYSPLGFAKTLAEGMKIAEIVFPRALLTQADGVEMQRKREYFNMKYVFNNNGTMFTPPNNKLDWTVLFLRTLPLMKEIDMCQDRFVIVTRISNIQDLIEFMKAENMKQFLQTVSVFGSEEFVEEVAEEFSLIGACRFPRAGEHNSNKMGAPWDGHYVLRDMVRWIYIGFLNQKGTKEELENAINLKDIINMQVLSQKQ